MADRPVAAAEPAECEQESAFFWDRFRDRSVERYLFERELSFVRRALGAEPRPCLVLDLACGSGRIALPLSQAGLSVIGMDLDAAGLAAFRRRSAVVPLLRADAECLPIAASSFDAVLAIQALDYLDLRLFLRETHRVLRGGGLLIFDALNRRSYKRLLRSGLGGGLQLPSANLSSTEILRAVATQGFAPVEVRGYNWPPATRESNSRLVAPLARLEELLGLDRWRSISPKILVAARKVAL